MFIRSPPRQLVPFSFPPRDPQGSEPRWSIRHHRLDQPPGMFAKTLKKYNKPTKSMLRLLTHYGCLLPEVMAKLSLQANVFFTVCFCHLKSCLIMHLPKYCIFFTDSADVIFPCTLLLFVILFYLHAEYVCTAICQISSKLISDCCSNRETNQLKCVFLVQSTIKNDICTRQAWKVTSCVFVVSNCRLKDL